MMVWARVSTDEAWDAFGRVLPTACAARATALAQATQPEARA